MRPLAIAVLLATASLALVSPAQAHIASNGFLTLQVERASVHGTLELALRDAEIAVGLDRNRDGRIDWGELRTGQSALQSYVQSHLRLISGGRDCDLSFRALEVNARVDGNYLWLPFAVQCERAIEQLGIDYRVLQDEDPSHRALLSLQAYGQSQTAVLGASRTPQYLDLAHPSRAAAFLEYLRAGVWHIWSGIDHLLFLLSLLLPAVLVRRQRHWEAVALPAPALAGIVRVVTAFTLAHSLTLSLAALDVVRLPGRLTESVIAASIIVAALNNVLPRITEGRWRIAFAFGLLHGFGFASVLAEMGLPHGARLLSLLAFNLGVELGQLAVVLAVMPLAFLARSTSFYRRTLLPWGSSAIAALALVWLVQRASA